jgi:uncharacterized membrane-anchored protein
MRPAAAFPRHIPEPEAAKVPEITAVFWTVKVLTTGMGEAASDWLGKISIVLAGAVGLLGLVTALWWQFRTRRYRPVVYWSAVAMVAVFGTMTADAPHKVLGLSYEITTAAYAIALALVFFLWRRTEGTLSIHSIVTRRREVWYWLIILLTFALGTAAGDLTALALNLGFLPSGVLFAVVIALPALAWWRFGLNPVVAFWWAYVVTRPLGASFADWLGKPPEIGGGLGFGDGTVTAVALVVFVLLVGYVARTRHGVQERSDVAGGDGVAARSDVTRWS